MKSEGRVYSPETVELVSKVLKSVWESLPSSTRRRMDRATIAKRILEEVAAGERDMIRLRAAALRPNILSMFAHAQPSSQNP